MPCVQFTGNCYVHIPIILDFFYAIDTMLQCVFVVVQSSYCIQSEFQGVARQCSVVTWVQGKIANLKSLSLHLKLHIEWILHLNLLCNCEVACATLLVRVHKSARPGLQQLMVTWLGYLWKVIEISTLYLQKCTLSIIKTLQVAQRSDSLKL